MRPESQKALVIGGSRGVGLALVQQLLASQDYQAVFATSRNAKNSANLRDLECEFPDALIPFDCDVTQDDSIERLCSAVAGVEGKLTMVINAAGILHEPGLAPEKSLRALDRSNLSRIFNVNCFGPLMVARHSIPLIPRTMPARFVALSAMVGSIADNGLGGWYSYRASKAALNQAMKTLAIECRRTHPQLCVTVIHPGTTNTELSRPFQGNVKPGNLYTPGQSAERIMGVVNGGKPEESGRFMNWDGNPIPW